MSEKEIKDLASQYAKYKSPIAEYIRAYDKRDNLNEAYRIEAERVLNFLSSRYCLVEKSKIRKWVDESEFTAFDSIDLIEIFDDLFGDELFTDTEQ